MKRLIVVLAGILISMLASAQCNIGNEDTTSFNMGNIIFSEDYILGTKYTLNTDGVLQSINLYGQNTGANVQMAVYDDNNGVPNNLLISSEIATVGNGIISFDVSPTQLSPGDYWIMAIYNTTDFHSYTDGNAVGNSVYYTEVNFGDPLPTNASEFSSFEGYDYTYFLEITCGSLAIDHMELKSEITIYPNPTSESIYVSNENNENYMLKIIDVSGSIIKSIKVNSSEIEIDIRDLSTGSYLLLIDNIVSKRFVVQ